MGQLGSRHAASESRLCHSSGSDNSDNRTDGKLNRVTTRQLKQAHLPRRAPLSLMYSCCCIAALHCTSTASVWCCYYYKHSAHCHPLLSLPWPTLITFLSSPGPECSMRPRSKLRLKLVLTIEDSSSRRSAGMAKLSAIPMAQWPQWPKRWQKRCCNIRIVTVLKYLDQTLPNTSSTSDESRHVMSCNQHSDSP